MLALEPQKRSRKPSLTPMIDVVFLLLVFFMLASRFGMDNTMPLQLAGNASTPYSGPPRLIDIRPETLSLNGVEMQEKALLSELDRLTESKGDMVILRSRDAASLQRVIDTMGTLNDAGFSTLTLVE